MLDFLMSPIDPSRVHEVGFAASWHGRFMVLAWGVLAPFAVMAARFFKIMPGQDWPRQLDNQVWWRSHWMGHSLVVGLSIFGLVLVLPSNWSNLSVHGMLGYTILIGLLVQILLGVFRGDKGGPTQPKPDGSLRGHHYDMTRWRRIFEALHKSLGYGLLGLGVITILFGLWHANGPVWMWFLLTVWWIILVGCFVFLQRRGFAVDTYQAIWGPDETHPGNRGPKPGWAVKRPSESMKEKDVTDVRNDRGHRVRSH
ncbi:MAG: cytochrome b561 domain-containing protein [Paracoccaceae bacterium]